MCNQYWTFMIHMASWNYLKADSQMKYGLMCLSKYEIPLEGGKDLLYFLFTSI